MIEPTDDSADPVFKLYHYNPSIAAAVIFVLLFVGTTGAHVYQLCRARTWFMIPLAIGGICELDLNPLSFAMADQYTKQLSASVTEGALDQLRNHRNGPLALTLSSLSSS
jgi:hypothetical protein